MSTISQRTIITAAKILRAGGVAIIPTDTVYGIAACPNCPSAVARVRSIKKRQADKPIALLAADKESVIDLCEEVPETARELMRAFWPGALTLVLPRGDAFEGFRVPNHPQTRELIKACGGTLRVTSANLSGAMPALSTVEALKDVGVEADLVIDAGISPGGIASTVVKVDARGAITILREGAIDSEQIYSACISVRPRASRENAVSPVLPRRAPSL